MCVCGLVITSLEHYIVNYAFAGTHTHTNATNSSSDGAFFFGTSCVCYACVCVSMLQANFPRKIFRRRKERQKERKKDKVAAYCLEVDKLALINSSAREVIVL